MKLAASVAGLLFAASLIAARAGEPQKPVTVAEAQALLDKANQATDANDWAADAALSAVPYLSGDNVLLTEKEVEDGARDANQTIESSSCQILTVLDKTGLMPWLPDVAKKFAADSDLIVLAHEKDKPKSGELIDYLWGGFFRRIDGQLRITGAIDDPIEMIVDKGDKKRFAGDQKGAIEIYNIAIQLAPNDADPYTMRGFSHEKLSDYAKARSDFAKAVELDPKDSIFRNNLANALMKLNQDGAAMDQYSESIRLDAQNIEAFMDRGTLRDKQGDFKDAVDDFNRAVAIPPPYPTWYNVEHWSVSDRALTYKLMGDTKMKMKDYAGAAAAYSSAINESPKFPQAYEGRAQAKAKLNDAAGSAQDTATAKQIRADPNKSPAFTLKSMLESLSNSSQ